MATVLSTVKLPGGSIKRVERRVSRMVTEMPEGKPISVYLEQEDVTYIDDQRVSAESAEPVVIGHKDVVDDAYIVALQDLVTALDERVAANEANKSERAKADAEIALAAEIATIDEK